MNGARQIWGMPLLLAALTVGGLLTALLGDGFWRWLSWLMLSVPVVVGLYYAWRRG